MTRLPAVRHAAATPRAQDPPAEIIGGADGMTQRRRRRKRACQYCKKPFESDPRRRGHQKYCSQKRCRQASKAASQRRWAAKNQGYFSGPEHRERLRAWREKHPGYWREQHKSAETAARLDLPIQDLIDTQVIEPLKKYGHLNLSIQDVMADFSRRLLQLAHRK
jgi:hypothetical protein